MPCEIINEKVGDFFDVSRRKLNWMRTTIPERTKIKLWQLIIGNTTYPSWLAAIDAEVSKYQEWKDGPSGKDTGNYSVFDEFDIKFIPGSRNTYNLLYEELMLMPFEYVIKLPSDLQSGIMQLRPELGSEKHPRRKVEVTEMTSLPEKYLIDHYQKLNKVLGQFYDRLRTPELSELCLSTLEGRMEVSYLYESGIQWPAIIYEKGAVRLDVEDFFLWKYLEKHLVTEFPEFSENLGDWKKGIATIVEECHDITNLIATQLAEMRLDSAEPYLSRDSKDYAPGVYYDILVTSTYKCVIAGCVPKFDRVPDDTRGLLLHIMEGPTGRKEIARSDTSLLNQVEECCLGIVSDDAIKEKVEQVLGLAKQAEVILEPIKQNLRLVLERGIFKGTCSVCADLVSQGN